MGHLSFRTYHQVTGADRSGLLQQVMTQRQRVADRLRSVRRTVAVMSGKGGVGKTFVTAGLAEALQARSAGAVGVLDADLKSPTAARLLGATGPLTVSDGVEPAVGRAGVRVFSMDLLLAEGQPLTWKEPAGERFLWRGALETGALREFLGDVAWGTLDWLLVDLPPGGDRLADLAELVPGLAGAVVITIPSEESRRSVARSIRGALDLQIPVLGIVENMSGYACPGCAQTAPLFPGNAGDELSREFGLPVLARIPFSPPPALRAPVTDALVSLADHLARMAP